MNKAIDIAINDGSPHIAIAVSTFKVLDGVIRQALTEEAEKVLKKNHHVTLRVDDETAIEIIVVTKECLLPAGFEGPIVAGFVSPDHAKTLTQHSGCTDVILVPQISNEAEDFAAEFDSEELP